MAIEKRWIRNGIIATSCVLLLFVLLQIAITATVNTIGLSTTVVFTLNSSIEFTCLALFIMPSVWLGFAAAMSRHRGVFITLTVLISLSVLSAIGFLVYEGYVFGTADLYSSNAGPLAQGLLVSKLVCWCIIVLLLIMFLGFAIAGDCSRPHPEFKYSSQYNSQSLPMNFMPQEYVRQKKPMAIEPSREYPRIVGPPAPARYADYPPVSPRQFYPSRY